MLGGDLNDLLDASELLSPVLDGLDVITHALTGLEGSGGISKNFLEVGNGARNVTTLGSRDSGSNVLLNGLSTVIASLNFCQFVLFNKVVEHASNEDGDTLDCGGKSLLSLGRSICGGCRGRGLNSANT